MALKAVEFSEDSLRSYNYCSKEYNLYTSCDNNNNNNNNNFDINYDFANYPSILLLDDNEKTFLTNNDGIFDVINSNGNVYNQWDQLCEQQYNTNVLCDYSSPERCFSGEVGPQRVLTPTAVNTDDGAAQRKRRRRSRKNKEEVEQQRMTHITVERNRRKQMNEYLATIRSLMPPSYVQRGDQASIVGGAINYVKELEQLLQSMQAQKRNNVHQDNHPQQNQQEDDDRKAVSQSPNGVDDIDNNKGEGEGVGVASSSSETTPPPLFGDFFSFPQYSITRSDTISSRNSATGDIEVTMVESHANVKILAKKQPKQLVKLIAGFQGLRLNVLHLNVTTLDSFVLYSLSLKVEEGCQLNSVDDIAAASNYILGQIQEEAVGLLQ